MKLNLLGQSAALWDLGSHGSKYEDDSLLGCSAM
jgi:hypothetical protein